MLAVDASLWHLTFLDFCCQACARCRDGVSRHIATCSIFTMQVSAMQQASRASQCTRNAATQPAIATALLLDESGWSMPPASRATAKARAADSKHAWARWLPQTQTPQSATSNAPQTPIYQPALADILRPHRSSPPPLLPPWSVAAPTHCAHTWPAHLSRVQAAAVSPCGRILLTAASSKDVAGRPVVRAWRLRDFSPGVQYAGHADTLRAVAVASWATKHAAVCGCGRSAAYLEPEGRQAKRKGRPRGWCSQQER